MHHVCAGARGGQEGIGSPGTGVDNGCELLTVLVLGIQPRFSAREVVLLTTEHSS